MRSTRRSRTSSAITTLECAICSPAWTESLSWAGSSGDDVGKTRGLNDFGRAVVREMNRLGMMVDVSHVSDKTFWDIVNTSTKPVIATHSGCRAIANVSRNLTDDMIQAIAKTGGVVNVIFYPEHLEPRRGAKRKRKLTPKSLPKFNALPMMRRATSRTKARARSSETRGVCETTAAGRSLAPG